MRSPAQLLKRCRIISFIRRAERPEISALDKKSLESFKSIDDAVFVAFLGPGNVELKSSFTTLASRNHNRFSFGVVSDGALAGAENILLGCIVRYKVGEEHQSLCAQSRLDILQDFVEESTAPLIGEMTRRNELKFLQVRFPIYLIDEKTELTLFRLGNHWFTSLPKRRASGKDIEQLSRSWRRSIKNTSTS